jgi:phage terminase small subunit
LIVAEQAAAPAATLPAVAPELSARDVRIAALQLALGECSPLEDEFARSFVMTGNATSAYIASHPGCLERTKRHIVRNYAWAMSNRPAVLARIREYESAAAAATIIDVQAILEHDLQIVQGYKHADEITQYMRVCCRYCYGTDHKYQWVDFAEYLAQLGKVEEGNEERRARKVRELPMPDDAGGYGYEPQAEPNIACPKCEGFGTERVIFADTTKLEGPARAIVKGVKVTANGTEILLHDVDKAKERLLRAKGVFGDDAASVARGAAAGAAAGSAVGAAAAASVAQRIKDMTQDEARRAYLNLVSGA